MRHSFTTACLVAVGVLAFLAWSVAENREPAAAGETVSELLDGDVIPLWATRLGAPYVRVGSQLPLAGTAPGLDCSPSLQISLISSGIAVRFDQARSVTEVYDRDYDSGWIVRYDIEPDLGYSSTRIPIDDGGVQAAEDLDGDGDVDLVSQFWDALLIRSVPDTALLAVFQWPGMTVDMWPVLVDVDRDGLPEICATPNSLGGTARVVIIDYDSTARGFVKLADIAAPNGAVGQPAVGDFDEDGRIEFIWGNNDYGYELFEWKAPDLVHIGSIGDSTDGVMYSAVACRPKPGGVLHALLGYSGGGSGYRYHLLEPTGDNTFTTIRVFQESTGLMGDHPCWAADVNCDGLDEMVMGFTPNFRVWEWVEEQSAFMESCTWDVYVYGALYNWYTLDLNQDSVSEWGSVSGQRWFYAFPHPDCVYCDTLGICPFPSDPCPPGCQGPGADPGSLVFDLYLGEEHEPQRIDVLSGGCVEPWWATPSSEWLQVDPVGGLASGSVRVWVDFTGLTAPDTLRDTLVITSRCPSWPPTRVSVDLYLSPVCLCLCHADPTCDTVTNVLDVVAAVDVAFRGGAVDPDPSSRCPVARTDVDCDSLTNVLDVVHLVNVAFRSGDPAVEFCDPCP